VKSKLQIRAEQAASKFAETARKPIVVEFAGVPKAGKTSTLGQVQAFFKRCGFRTEVVVERASVCPIRDKKHANFNIWTVCTTLAQILEKTQDPPRGDDPHILFLDRGIFDSICWLSMMERLARIRSADRQIIENFLLIDDWCKRVTTIIVMLASPEDAMKREQGHLPVENGKGSIMNKDVLQQINKTNLECAQRFKNLFRINTIDTSSGDTKDDPRRTAEVVAEIILSTIEKEIEENIMSLDKSIIRKVFAGKSCLLAPEAHKVTDLFLESGSFIPREQVESDSTLVQALPVVIVRNASGEILRLKRRERSEDNPLHEKVVIWAGGHVRAEDATNDNPLLCCAVREVKEELRLNVEPSDLKIVAAIYLDNGGGASKHVAIVFEWCAKSDDVAVALSKAEFFERRGTSLSGTFVSLSDLARDVDKAELNEPWSVELVRECLGKNSFDFGPRLF